MQHPESWPSIRITSSPIWRPDSIAAYSLLLSSMLIAPRDTQDTLFRTDCQLKQSWLVLYPDLPWLPLIQEIFLHSHHKDSFGPLKLTISSIIQRPLEQDSHTLETWRSLNFKTTQSLSTNWSALPIQWRSQEKDVTQYQQQYKTKIWYTSKSLHTKA